MEKQFYRIKEMAALLDVSLHHLRKMRKQGSGPPFLQPSPYLIRYPICGYEAWKQRKLEEPKKTTRG
tara:strand:+ start:936 stop:1136 length:201 start_codon:yes stop_codon:yes gene_type:complete